MVDGARAGRTRTRTRAAARGDRRRRGRAARAADHPDRRPVRRPRPRAPAHDALPAAARRQPLLMAATADHIHRPAEGVPLPARGRVDRRAARRRPRRRASRRSRSRRRPSSAAPTPRPGARRTSSSPRPPRVWPSPSPASPPAPASPTRSLKVDGDGVVGQRSDGRFGFTRLLLRLELETDPTEEAQARRARRAGRGDLPRLRLARPARRP